MPTYRAADGTELHYDVSGAGRTVMVLPAAPPGTRAGQPGRLRGMAGPASYAKWTDVEQAHAKMGRTAGFRQAADPFLA